MKALSKQFYAREPTQVARDLLGKTLIRKLNSKVLTGRIVETEAYFGEKDPASRAHMGRKPYNELMFLDVGRTFIYMVHGNWLLNIIAHSNGEAGGVLIRAIEPLQGAEIMLENRKVEKISDLTNGPGKLTKALAVTHELNALDVTKSCSAIIITEGKKEHFEICSSHRIGVTADLPQQLRFFIKGNSFVSR